MRGDAELLEAWQAGDQGAGNDLFERYFEPLFRFFRSKVDDAAEDLVQQTFLALVRSGGGMKNAASFRSYVFTAARSKLYRYLSQRAAKLGPIDFGVDSIAAISPSPNTWATEREEQRVLYEALRRLPVESQITLELYYLEGFEGEEVADILGVPVGTVRSRIRRGIARLRREMEQIAQRPALIERSLSQLRADRPDLAGDDLQRNKPTGTD